MKHNSRVFVGNQPIRSQSDILRSFTLVNVFGDEVVLVARSVEALTSVLGSQPALDGVLSLGILADRLWSGHVCVLAVCELVIIPDTQRVARLEVEYVDQGSMSSDVYILGA